MIRNEVVQQLILTGKLSDGSARLGERANYCCEYCGLDLLSSPETYKLWQHDHIIPLSRGGDPTDLDNIAVACKPCNWDFKRDWDPRSSTVPNASRDELIAAIREFIKSKKAETEQELVLVRAIVGFR